MTGLTGRTAGVNAPRANRAKGIGIVPATGKQAKIIWTYTSPNHTNAIIVNQTNEPWNEIDILAKRVGAESYSGFVVGTSDTTSAYFPNPKFPLAPGGGLLFTMDTSKYRLRNLTVIANGREVTVEEEIQPDELNHEGRAASERAATKATRETLPKLLPANGNLPCGHKATNGGGGSDGSVMAGCDQGHWFNNTGSGWVPDQSSDLLGTSPSRFR